MKSSGMRFLIIATSIALGWSAVPRGCYAQAACPLNYINGVPSSDPVQTQPCGFGEECAGGQYDAIAGTVEATTAGTSSCGAGASELWVDDVFVVSNLTTGEPVTFRVRLEAVWNVDVVRPLVAVACAYVGSAEEERVSCLNGIADPAEITITRFVGEPFELTYRVAAGFTGFEDFCYAYNQWASTQGHLVFLDLPPGAVVRSCQGFVQGDVTAVEGDSERHIDLAIKRLTPNPTDGAFAVTALLPSDAPAVLEVFDVRGRLVASTPLSGIGRGEHIVNVRVRSHLASGVYFTRLTQGSRTAWAKEVVAR